MINVYDLNLIYEILYQLSYEESKVFIGIDDELDKIIDSNYFWKKYFMEVIVPKIGNYVYDNKELNEAKLLFEKCNGLLIIKDKFNINDDLNGIENMNELVYRCKELKEIPIEMKWMKKLQKLFLCGNQLAALPDSIAAGAGNFSSLQKLDLGWNKLTVLPDSIENLSSLQELYLENNQLTVLPDSICNLSSLRILNLCGNHLSALPDSIVNLSSLQILVLCGNQLTTLPKFDGNVTIYK
jgi:Leucine-rich repeat (LRR) protein